MRIQISEPTLGLRANGAIYRAQILKWLDEEPVEVDFSRVHIVSHSWADECIAKLLSEIGLEKFQEKFRMLNVAADVGLVIKEAIFERNADLLRKIG